MLSIDDRNGQIDRDAALAIEQQYDEAYSGLVLGLQNYEDEFMMLESTKFPLKFDKSKVETGPFHRTWTNGIIRT